MSEFDDFVTEDDEADRTHQPKKRSNDETRSAAEIDPDSEDQRSSSGSSSTQSTAAQNPSELENGDAQSANRTEVIEDSTPRSWEREQFAMFFHEDSVYGYEDLMYDAEGTLKREYDVRNATRYELDQALIDIALESVSSDELAERLLENRGFDL